MNAPERKDTARSQRVVVNPGTHFEAHGVIVWPGFQNVLVLLEGMAEARVFPWRSVEVDEA